MKLLSIFAVFFIITTLNASELYSLKYDPKRDPFSDGKAAIALAQQTNRRILIEVGGDWCKWCHILDGFINSNPEIKRELYNTFVVLKVNVSDENSNQDFLAAFPKIKGYPHMFVTESSGSVIHSQDVGEFIENSKYSKKKFLLFLKKWKLNPVSAGVR